ncbi:phage Gp37/Gp68 family protein [bacterium]|nr:phage Gp37/Gp68 family protein [bacterium]
MGKDSAISWTHHTFNPWWGCEKISPACTHCYAETFAKRFPASRGLWGKNSTRRFQSDKYWNAPLKWNRDAAASGERRRVFCASMADVFEDRADLVPHRARLFELIRRTPNLDWLLLTKRPENWNMLTSQAAINMPTENGTHWIDEWTSGTAPKNVWLGTTVENQEMADKRIPALLKIPAKVRFLSCEPLLGPVDLRAFAGVKECKKAWLLKDGTIHDISFPKVDGIDWVICGGESGAHARPMHPDWARSLRDQCAASGVPFHFKQWGDIVYREVVGAGQPLGDRETLRIGKEAAGRLLDGVLHDGVLHDAFPNP